MKHRVLAILLLIQILFVFGTTQPEIKAIIKQKLIHADRIYLHSFMLRQYHNEHLPHISETLDKHSTHDYDWLETGEFLTIAHGLGPKLYAGANTLGTLNKGWERGFRLFEVDLSLTTDNRLVCYHGSDERELNRTSYGNLLKIVPVPCTFSEIVKFALQHPDARFVLDVKNRYDDAYIQIKKEIGNRQLGKSFIPQVYDFQKLPKIRKGNFFGGEIFTSYRSVLSNRQIFDAAAQYDIRAVTLTLSRFNDDAGKFPKAISIFTHPVNDPFMASKIKKFGGNGIYTSYITKDNVPELFQSCVNTHSGSPAR